MEKYIEKLTINRIIKIIFFIWLISFFIVEGLIIFNGNSDQDKKVEYAVILGAGLRGERLSPILLDRMNKGLEYLQDNPQTKVIVTGGKGPGENVAEAVAMKRYLVKNGIDESRIIKEDKSTSTIENIKFTKEILKIIDDRDRYEIMIITNKFHLFRAKLLAKQNDLVPYGTPTKTIIYLLPKYYIREYFAVIKSLVFDI